MLIMLMSIGVSLLYQELFNFQLNATKKNFQFLFNKSAFSQTRDSVQKGGNEAASYTGYKQV